MWASGKMLESGKKSEKTQKTQRDIRVQDVAHGSVAPHRLVQGVAHGSVAPHRMVQGTVVFG